ncbi:hypothetical protein ACRDU6_08345 [Mycolicibacterium sp. ELW1]|uniref:hypothetical protein n=1 Tax=unclassified Mycolicibacterium TaxID=2636767 RepID=UPI003D7728C7
MLGITCTASIAEEQNLATTANGGFPGFEHLSKGLCESDSYVFGDQEMCPHALVEGFEQSRVRGHR